MALAGRHALPTVYNQREYAEAGRAKHGIARAGPARASAERTSANSRPARQPPEPAAEAPPLAPVSEERPAPPPPAPERVPEMSVARQGDPLAALNALSYEEKIALFT